MSEVISTIMLNAVTIGMIAFLTSPDTFGRLAGNNIGRRRVPDRAPRRAARRAAPGRGGARARTGRGGVVTVALDRVTSWSPPGWARPFRIALVLVAILAVTVTLTGQTSS